MTIDERALWVRLTSLLSPSMLNRLVDWCSSAVLHVQYGLGSDICAVAAGNSWIPEAPLLNYGLSGVAV